MKKKKIKKVAENIVLPSISIPLLKKQKMALLECDMPDDEKNGLLNLLDYIQDIAEGYVQITEQFIEEFDLESE